jgi:hypothetical protein
VVARNYNIQLSMLGSFYENMYLNDELYCSLTSITYNCFSLSSGGREKLKQESTIGFVCREKQHQDINTTWHKNYTIENLRYMVLEPIQRIPRCAPPYACKIGLGCTRDSYATGSICLVSK